MKYYVELYLKGRRVKYMYASAKSHNEAVRFVTKNSWQVWTNVIVVNEKLSARRYYHTGKTFKALKETPSYFKTFIDSVPGVLVMLGKYAEIHTFESIKERDEVYQLCTTYDRVESAKGGKEQSDTTASFEETSGSKSGLTLKKTSNGSATPVTWMARQIHFRTAAPSGFDSAGDSESRECERGSYPYRSLPNQIFAIVKKFTRKMEPPFWNKSMVQKIGKVIQVTKFAGMWIDKDGNKYNDHWLQKDGLKLKVKTKLPKSENDLFPDSMKRYVRRYQGETMVFEPCTNHYTAKGICIPMDWLEIVDYKGKEGLFIGGKNGKVIWLPNMKQYVGKKMHFVGSANRIYFCEEMQLFVNPDWVEFPKEYEYNIT